MLHFIMAPGPPPEGTSDNTPLQAYDNVIVPTGEYAPSTCKLYAIVIAQF